MKNLGTQRIIEYYDCNPGLINDEAHIRDCMLKAIHEARATLVSHHFQRFSPHGISGVVIIAESHVTIHTWPEFRYAAVDIFTCDRKINLSIIENSLRQGFDAKNSFSQDIARGLMEKFTVDLPLR